MYFFAGTFRKPMAPRDAMPGSMKDNKHAITVLGVGSVRDRAMIRSVQMAAKELQLPVDILLITDIEAFMQFGISGIPALVIRDKVVASDRIPAVTEIKRLLQEAYQSPPNLQNPVF